MTLRSSTVAILAGAVTVLSVATACSTLGIDGGTGERARLERNRAKWQQHAFPAYRFTYSTECFCTVAAITIEVRDAVVVSAGYTGSAEPVPVYVQDRLPTVDSLFAIVERAIADEVDLLEVRYHEVLGYPTRIAIDRSFNVADEEIVHTAHALTPISEN